MPGMPGMGGGAGAGAGARGGGLAGMMRPPGPKSMKVRKR